MAVISLHTSPTAALGHSANGGLNVYVRELCRDFSERGIATDVFTRVASGERRPVEHLAPHCRVVSLPVGEPGLGKYELISEVESFADAVEDFALERDLTYDLVYSHYWLSGAAAAILRTRWGVPWAHTAHTLALVKNRSLAPGDRREPRLRELVEADIAAGADLLVASTPSEADDLLLCGGTRDRVTVVAPGVDIERFRPTDRAVARRRLGLDGVRPVLFVGRLERLKGAEIAVRAFAGAAQGHSDARLLVLGGDSRSDGESERERLAEIAVELGIADRVRFAGSVPHGDLPLYYSASEALLMPSYSESFGLVGLEAQACGCPVIAADVAGLASVVRDEVTGFLVAGHDPGDYAARLRQVLDDPDLGLHLGRRATLLAQRFSWERTGSLLLDAFEPLFESAADAAAGRGHFRVQVSATQE